MLRKTITFNIQTASARELAIVRGCLAQLLPSVSKIRFGQGRYAESVDLYPQSARLIASVVVSAKQETQGAPFPAEFLADRAIAGLAERDHLILLLRVIIKYRRPSELMDLAV